MDGLDRPAIAASCFALHLRTVGRGEMPCVLPIALKTDENGRLVFHTLGIPTHGVGNSAELRDALDTD